VDVVALALACNQNQFPGFSPISFAVNSIRSPWMAVVDADIVNVVELDAVEVGMPTYCWNPMYPNRTLSLIRCRATSEEP